MSAGRGTPFVVSAPSGTGKTTVCRQLVERDPAIVFSISHTTRAPRPGERDGVDYHFVKPGEFRRMIDAGAFLEYAEYSGHLYGSSWKALDAPLAEGLDVLLEIETDGARQVRERRADAHLVFLLPPSLAALEARLRGRGTDAGDEVDRRLAIARREFQAAAWFDSFVVNDDVESAVRAVHEVVRAVRAGERVTERASRAAVIQRLDPVLASWVGS